MTNYCVSSISACKQCKNSADVLHVVNNLVACFKYLHTAIVTKRINLIYDLNIEQQQLIDGQHILSTINNLPIHSSDGSDVKKLWFIYTKNHAYQASSNILSGVTIIAGDEVKLVNICRDLIHLGVRWISFGGKPWLELPEYNVTVTGYAVVNVKNVHNLDALKQLLPRYEPSGKHHYHPYHDANGENVSPMPLNQEEAQRLLLLSVQDGADLWSYHEGLRKYYRYKLTHTDQNIYHGFEVDEDMVPQRIKNQF